MEEPVSTQNSDPQDTRNSLVMAVSAMAPADREPAAEEHLRRPGIPGPAAEHAMQHLVGMWADAMTSGSDPDAGPRRKSRSVVIANGADDFYAKQYRQYLSGAKGAFAATATHALICAGTLPLGSGGGRAVRAAMVEGSPLVVLDHQSLAVAVPIPRAFSNSDDGALWRWLNAGGEMPDTVSREIEGRAIASLRPGARAVERSRLASVLEVVDVALATGRLAVLALHPRDPDAMGLHITLFGVVGCDAATLAAQHGLDPDFLGSMVDAADSRDHDLLFLAGGTEEIFTQCSQNLFVKRTPRDDEPAPASNSWSPSDPLTELLDAQFELLQATVSASGLPGASPRNGDAGSVAYVVDQGEQDAVLIPYHPGNFIHGHAAKLWTNPHGAIVVHDDHDHLRRVTLRGPCRVLSPEEARACFPDVVATEIARTSTTPGKREPAYWFEQTVADIVVEAEPLERMALDETRPTCTISAAGQGKYGKKPAYFDAASTPPYDQGLQHRREAAGRPTDPSGHDHRRWLELCADRMAERVEHVNSIGRS
jgi:hypothetical protein